MSMHISVRESLKYDRRISVPLGRSIKVSRHAGLATDFASLDRSYRSEREIG